MERYFIARAKVHKEILELAKREDLEEIKIEFFKQAVGGKF